MPIRPYIIALSIIIASSLGCDSPATSPATHAPLLGSWRIVDERWADAGLEIIWTFDGSSVVIATDSGDIISQSLYTIDETKDPHHITMHIHDIVDELRPGIFAVTDDELRLSFSVDGSPRPRSFQDGASLTLRRMSP